jgi:tetratricopeptide (TPR) repeat protein/TM2 domain-containing membrane protein YozV
LDDNSGESYIEWKNKGNQHAKVGEYQEAIECYSKALEINPKYCDAWNNIGYCLTKLGKIDDAEFCKNKVIQIKEAEERGTDKKILNEEIVPIIQKSPVKQESSKIIGPELPGKNGDPSLTVTPSDITSKTTEETSANEDFCLNCGEKIGDTKSNICPKCGIRLSKLSRFGTSKGTTHPGKIKNPIKAAILSTVWPGMGQTYNGQYGKGFIIILGTIFGLFVFIVPGVIIWLIGIVDAYRISTKMNHGDLPFNDFNLGGTLAFIFVPILLIGIIFSVVYPTNLQDPTHSSQSSSLTNYQTSSTQNYQNLDPPAKNPTITQLVTPTATPNSQKINILTNIVQEYHRTHTYYANDIYVCSDMAADVWNMVETKGINAKIEIGNVEKDIVDASDVNHAWVLAEVNPGEWIALETTGGTLVYRAENPRYYTGYSFPTPKELKEYTQLAQQSESQTLKYNQAAADYNNLLTLISKQPDYYSQSQLISQANSQLEVVNQRAADLSETNQKITQLLSGSSGSQFIKPTILPPTQQSTSTQNSGYITTNDQYFKDHSQVFFSYLETEWDKVNDAIYRGDYDSALQYATKLYDNELKCDETIKDNTGRCVGTNGIHNYNSPLSSELDPVHKEYLEGIGEFKRGAFWTIATLQSRNSGDAVGMSTNYNTATQYLSSAKNHFNQANYGMVGGVYPSYYDTKWVYLSYFR